MAPARGGRRGRAEGTDRSEDGGGLVTTLRSALAEALGVEAGRLDVSVRLDGEEPPTDRVVGSVVLVTAPAEASAPDVRSGSAADEDAAGADRGHRREATEREAGPVTAEELDEEAEAAADLLEGLLDAMDLPGQFRISVHEAHAEVEITGSGDGVLIGRRGQTLEAIQDLVRTAMQRRFERRSRVLVDVDGYRARRLEKLFERADEAVQEVLATGEPQRLEPMDAIERRLVHQRVAAHGGVVSNSHGREPARRIVIELVEDD